MDSFFTRFDGATWGRPGRLHVYAVASDTLREVVARYHAALDGVAQAQGLGLQPPEFVHFTVQMLRVHRDDLAPDQLGALVDKLAAALAEHEPLTLRVGPPAASQHAVELWVDPAADEPWGELVAATRRAAATVLGEDALPPLAGNATPHTSLGYGIGPGDSGVITSALKALRPRPGLIDVPVQQVYLVSVRQLPEQGRYVWETLAELPLGGGSAPRVGP